MELPGGHSEADTEIFSEAESESESEADTYSTSEGYQETDTEAFTRGWNAAVTKGDNQALTDGTSHTLSEGVTPSMSEEHGISESHTIQPLTPEEQTLLQIQTLKALPKAHFTLKVPGKSAVTVRAPWVEDPKITKKVLEAGLQRVYALPYYTSIEVLNGEAHEQSASIYRALPPPPESDEDDDIDCWRTERPTL